MIKRILLAVVALIALAGVGAGIAYSNANLEKSVLSDDIREKAGGSYVRLPDGIVHYQIAGPDTGRTILLVHGFSVPYYVWDPAFDALVAAGFRVLRYDMFGRGFSDRPDVAYDADLTDRQITGLLDALKIAEPVDIAGLSMGGAVVETFANRHPERTHSVILMDPSFSHGTARMPWAMHVPILNRFLFTVSAGPGMAQGQMGDFHHPDRFPGWPERYRVQMRYPGFLRALMRTQLASEGRDLSLEYGELGKKEMPVLLIWGREDHTVPFERSEELRKLIPRAQFYPIDDAGHVPYMEQPDVVNPILIRFLSPLPATPRPRTAAPRAR